MNYRKLGKTNFNISEISLGTWQVGGKWGSAFDNKTADELLKFVIFCKIILICFPSDVMRHKTQTGVGKCFKIYTRPHRRW